MVSKDALFWPRSCAYNRGIMIPGRIAFYCSLSLLALVTPVLAQETSYSPPPMFGDDQVRPETTTGNIVEKRISPRGDAPRPSVAPSAPVPPSAPATLVAPAVNTPPSNAKTADPSPDFMQPLVEDVKKPEEIVTAPVKKPDAPKSKVVKETNALKTPTPPKKPTPAVATAKGDAKTMPPPKPQADQKSAIVPPAVLPVPAVAPAPAPSTASSPLPEKTDHVETDIADPIFIPEAKPAPVAKSSAKAAAVMPAPVVPPAPVAKKSEPALVKSPRPDARPASKVTSNGVVTGPKTMPSVPAQPVEQEMLDVAVLPSSDQAIPRGPDQVPAPDTGPTILERHQQQMKAKRADKTAEEKTEPVDPVATLATAKTASKEQDVTPASFENGDAKDVLKKILPYLPGQIKLEDTEMASVGAGILDELKLRDQWRIQIRSYATAQGGGVNSDKRISLSRAIALRKALVDQGVRSSRIDVRAEGSAAHVGAGESGDRIDLYLYRPTKNATIF